MAKLVFITSRFPYPLNKGDKLRVYFQLKHLAEDNEIHLIALNEKAVSEKDLSQISALCSSVHLFVLPLRRRIIQLILKIFSNIPFQVAFFYDRRIAKNINKLIAEIRPDHIHCHLIRTTEYVKDISGIPKSLDFMDAFGKGMERRENAVTKDFRKAFYTWEKRRLYSYESSVFSFMDKFFIISDQDKNYIKTPFVDKIEVIPNGVDFEAFRPAIEKKIYDIVFMGNLGYPPNIDAVLFLVKKILPLVKIKKPEIKVLIAGINAPAVVRKLQSANINVIEHFADISKSIGISKIMVAPMQLSIGLQNKIIQAMAMKTPCIVSSLSNNAIKAPNNKALIEANTPQEYADEIIGLLDDDVKALALGKAGYDFVRAHFSWEQQNSLFKTLILNQN